MHDSPELHQDVLDWVSQEFKDILNDSRQAIYIYVCDRHRICNNKFSSMLGYDSPEDWAKKDEMLSDVKDEDQKILVSAYKDAMENKVASDIEISWKGKVKANFIKTKVILVPLSFEGEMFAMHFISKI